MSDYLSLLLIALQVLIFSQIFNERLYISVRNSIQIDLKRRPKNEPDELSQYRKIEKDLMQNESKENKKAADTLIYKAQSVPTKRVSDSRPVEKFKRPKRETVRVMNEELPVYKTMQFVDELTVSPIFSREETMPQIDKSLAVPKESN